MQYDNEQWIERCLDEMEKRINQSYVYTATDFKIWLKFAVQDGRGKQLIDGILDRLNVQKTFENKLLSTQERMTLYQLLETTNDQ